MSAALRLHRGDGPGKSRGGLEDDQNAGRRIWRRGRVKIFHRCPRMIPGETHQKNDRSRPPSLELVNVTKRFGAFTAADQVSLKIPPGTFHALLGENGAGKSTLVKCIMGFHAADEGDIIVDEHSRDIRSPHDAYKYGIGM